MINTLKELKKDAHWFVELAFIAINRKNETRAKEFLEVATLLDENYSLIDVAHASIHLHKMEFKPAKKLLDSVLAKHPKHPLASIFLAMCYTIQGDRDKGKELFKNTGQNASEEVKKMVQTSDNFINKSTKEKSMTDNIEPTKKIKKTVSPQSTDATDAANFASDLKKAGDTKTNKPATASPQQKPSGPVTADTLVKNRDMLHKKTEHLIKNGLEKADPNTLKQQQQDVILKHAYKYNDAVKDVNKQLGKEVMPPKIERTDNPIKAALKLLSNGENNIRGIGDIVKNNKLSAGEALLIQNKLNSATNNIDFITSILSTAMKGFTTLISTQV